MLEVEIKIKTLMLVEIYKYAKENYHASYIVKSCRSKVRAYI
jgi:hypothetical protein